MKAAILIGTLAWACLQILQAEPGQHVQLFNGQDLTGWVQKGGQAKFTVEDGQIVGTSVPGTPNSFLCTEREYGDFILEAEFKADPGFNSGIQIRSLAADTDTVETWEGKPAKFPAGRVHGLQAEIDTSPRAWTGGLHCEGTEKAWRWLADLKNNEPARQAFKQNEWNQLRIEAKGDSIKTWLNGVPAADLKNSAIMKGFIGLQVHEIRIGDTPLHVRFRSLKLQELP